MKKGQLRLYILKIKEKNEYEQTKQNPRDMQKVDSRTQACA